MERSTGKPETQLMRTFGMRLFLWANLFSVVALGSVLLAMAFDSTIGWWADMGDVGPSGHGGFLILAPVLLFSMIVLVVDLVLVVGWTTSGQTLKLGRLWPVPTLTGLLCLAFWFPADEAKIATVSILGLGKRPNAMIADAVSSGDPRLIRALLDAGKADRALVQSLMTFGIVYGKTDVVEFAITRGADVNERRERGLVSPLHEAAFNGNPSIVQVLLASGARADIRDSKGRTPLDLAREKERAEVVKLLEGKRAP